MSAPPLPDVFGNYALKDFTEIVPPEAINWLPQTVGWLCIAVVLGLWTLWSGWLRLRCWHHNRYRREATRQLTNMNSEDPDLLPKLNRLLKLVALVAFSREEVAKLSGHSWALFLNQKCESHVFDERAMALLSQGSYRPMDYSAAEAQNLLTVSRRWIIEHRGAQDA